MQTHLISTKEPVKLTQENHPENAMAPPVSPPPSGLASTIFLSCLSGILGMAFGSAALSTAFMAEKPYELISVLPLIVLGVCILCGWVGAFFWMVREESAHPTP